MTTVYQKSNLNEEELSSAIELMNNQHECLERNTPEKMKQLISVELDANISLERISNFFGFSKNIEVESLKIENYG